MPSRVWVGLPPFSMACHSGSAWGGRAHSERSGSWDAVAPGVLSEGAGQLLTDWLSRSRVVEEIVGEQASGNATIGASSAASALTFETRLLGLVHAAFTSAE